MAQDRNSATGPGSAGATTPFIFTNALPDVQRLMMAGPHMQAAIMKMGIEMQRELFSFLERRCHEDGKLADQIGSARSVGDLYSAWLDFCRDATTQYATEAGKAAEIGSQGTIDILYDMNLQREEVMASAREPKAA